MARKFSILAGSKEICSEKISGIFYRIFSRSYYSLFAGLDKSRIVSNDVERY